MRQFQLPLWSVLLTSLTPHVLAVPVSSAESPCDRPALLAAADAYVASQTAGKLDTLQLLTSSTWKYQENNKVANASTSVLTKALKIDNRRTIVDMTLCATYTELIVANPSTPYVIGTQIHHSADMKVALVDSIVSTTNSWLFNATRTLQYAQQEKWDEIPVEKRDSRELIKAAGDAYMDMWSNSTAEDAVPWGTPCARLEGGQYTGRGRPDDSCKAGIPSNNNQAPNSNRRYVIDESMGSVSILCVWEHMMMAADSHEFRLENGKVRYIHTMTVCGGQVCRL